MYLTDLLFRLPKGVFVRIRFDGESEQFCFTTGTRRTGDKVLELMEHGKDACKVYEITPLWHAQELYIRCS